ncbi:hypothetical protein MRX96_051233 [Rhipicephalus microplus]
MKLRRGDCDYRTPHFESTKRTNVASAVRMSQCESTRLRRGVRINKTQQFERKKRLRIELSGGDAAVREKPNLHKARVAPASSTGFLRLILTFDSRTAHLKKSAH